MKGKTQRASSKQGVESELNANSTNSNKNLKRGKRTRSVIQSNSRLYDGSNDIQVVTKKVKVETTESFEAVVKQEVEQNPVPVELENSCNNIASAFKNAIKSECDLEMKVVTEEIELPLESTQITEQVDTLFDSEDSDVKVLSPPTESKVYKNPKNITITSDPDTVSFESDRDSTWRAVELYQCKFCPGKRFTTAEREKHRLKHLPEVQFIGRYTQKPKTIRNVTYTSSVRKKPSTCLLKKQSNSNGIRTAKKTANKARTRK